MQGRGKESDIALIATGEGRGLRELRQKGENSVKMVAEV